MVWDNLDSKCGSASAVQVMSYVDFAVSIFLFVATAPLTIAILVGIYKYRHLLNRNYYLVITNIVVADCLMALICDPMSISFHIKEALGPKEAPINQLEQTTMTFIFFSTNIVAVMSMAVLTIDRLGIILSPFYYYGVVTKPRMKIILMLTWILSIGITIVYLFIGYIRFLVIFAFSTVVLTFVFMLVTMFLLRRRLGLAKQIEAQRRDSVSRVPVKNDMSRNNNFNNNNKENGKIFRSNRRCTENGIEFTEVDKKITKTFLVMLVLFILNYIPCVILITYMNLCEECNCDFVHVMRDYIWLAILSSPLCRSLNFVFRLTALREAVKVVFFNTEKESGSSSPLQTLNNQTSHC